MQPRKPTEAEKQELLDYGISYNVSRMGIATLDGLRERLNNWIENSPMAVFDDFQTENPGYKGKVLVCLPSFLPFPKIVDIFVWHNGKIVRVKNAAAANRIVRDNLAETSR